jgi:uncharacterized protein YprB with RNaseH-like and TPR domain
MSEVSERLRTLQRQIGRARTTAATDVVRSDLRRLLDLRKRAATRRLAAPAGIEIAEGLHLVEWRRPSEASRIVGLPWGETSEVERERLVCFDTETTGLAGGVGTRAFMIGSAQWRGGELVVRQLYLTALAGRGRCCEGLPAACRRTRSSSATTVGHTMRPAQGTLSPASAGNIRSLSAAVDLLYPVRRAYRGVWENCRLQTIERQLLGILRETTCRDTRPRQRGWHIFEVNPARTSGACWITIGRMS